MKPRIVQSLQLQMAKTTERVYTLEMPLNPRGDFTLEEKALLRPIAETLAMLDGNAFFTMWMDDGVEWYEQYLPEAWEIWRANGGTEGWTAGMAHVQEAKLRKENPMLQSLWEQYQTALRLSKEDTDA